MSGREWVEYGVLLLSMVGLGLVMQWALSRENKRGYREGYQCGRDEACEYVRAAEDRAKKAERRLDTMRIRHKHLTNLYLSNSSERRKVDDRLHNLRAERRLLRQKALGEGEDV